MRAVALVVAVAVVSGCGSGPKRLESTALPSAGIPIERALRTRTEEPVLVKGFLVVVRDRARLCSALAESYPPQCGGPSLRVEGLQTGDRGGLKEAGDVAWSEREIALLGTVDDGVLRVSATSP